MAEGFNEAVANGIDGDSRDNMNPGQREQLSYLESTTITLTDMGMDYGSRKAELMRLSQRWLPLGSRKSAVAGLF
ncbi:hypothetical protein D3C79_901340 [compost metagenome]